MYERIALLVFFNIYLIPNLLYLIRKQSFKNMVKYTIDDIIKYAEDNNITRTKDLPSNYLNYIYRYKLSHRLPFLKDKKEKATQRINQNRLQSWYDIERILPYLERWSIEEGTTIEQQAREGCLMPEWKDWCEKHPEYKDR